MTRVPCPSSSSLHCRPRSRKTGQAAAPRARRSGGAGSACHDNVYDDHVHDDDDEGENGGDDHDEGEEEEYEGEGEGDDTCWKCQDRLAPEIFLFGDKTENNMV